ncbi:MAG: DegV family protein [Oscillibacter sp.]|nr:DegV family protein [Oscillibacter sp.]
MVRIVSDTSTMYSTTQANEAGFTVSPLSVTIAGTTYREYDEIDSKTFVSIIQQGHMPTSSQPAIGAVEEVYRSFPGDQVLNIAMAHGLSGTYQSAVTAAELCEGDADVTVINSRTLCGPHRYMVEQAVKMAKENKTLEEILERVNFLVDSAKSYLIPADFGYLRRGGRLSPLVAHVGQIAHLAPVMTQTDDGTQLTIASVRRGFANAFKYVKKALEERGIGEGWRIYITHGDSPSSAELARKIIGEAFPFTTIEVLPLSPAFITQGGPGCIAIQVIHD